MSWNTCKASKKFGKLNSVSLNFYSCDKMNLLEMSGLLEALCWEVMISLDQKMVDVLSSSQQKFPYKIELMEQLQHIVVGPKILKMALETE